TNSSNRVTTQLSSSDNVYQQQLTESIQDLLTTNVQLGKRHDIEQFLNQINTFLTSSNTSQVSNLNTTLPARICDEFANRQLILQQMLIDTAHIDRLRVNFVAHFNTENNAILAANEITTLIENYPKEMTTHVRQWLTEQQKTRLTAPLAASDMSKIIEEFEEYLKNLEENLLLYEQNENNHTKLKNLINLIANRPIIPEQLQHDTKHLQERYVKIQQYIEDLQKKYLAKKANVDTMTNNINLLITHLRNIEEQIHMNAKQSVHDYERLLLDCQRIISELSRIRPQIEDAINSGKRLYSPDSKDTSGIESADETGGGSTTSTPLLSSKKHSDLTLRKVRRHVLQLTQHWKNANNSIDQRLKLLQRTQTAVEELRRKCDQLHAHLLEIELAYAHKPQIKALNVQQVPAEIEQAKHLLAALMSCKGSIDDVQQSAETIENEHDIPTVNRAQELDHRWQHAVSSVSQRIHSLQDSIKDTESDIYSNSVEHPWQRAISANKIPYFINHSDQTTSWDHPKILELMRSFANFNDIRFSAYRTAMKLRALQKRLCLDLTSLSDIIGVFEQEEVTDALNKMIDIDQIQVYLQKIFEKTANEYPQLINGIVTVDLTLNWLLNIYDLNRTGSIRLLSMKMALTLLCRGNIEEKYRYIFSLVTFEYDGRFVADRQGLSLLFQQAIVIPKQLGEIAAFGGSSVEPSVQSCFEYSQNADVITAEDFLEWVKLEPQSLVWLPVMHRLAASEVAKHEARCNICKIYPILGFRYRSLRHFNCDICQNCFFSGKQTKLFKMDHPLQEYYTETTSSEDIRDFFRIFRNKLCAKQRKSPRLGYLPLPHVFDNTMTTTDQPTAPSPIVSSLFTTPIKSEHEMMQPTVHSNGSNDEHGIIAQHCRNLNSATYKSPRIAAHELLTRSTSLDNEQRNELEAVIRDLEEENRLLQNEYERLCHEHMEKSLIITDSQEPFPFYDNQSDHYNSREILREAKQLRHHKTKLEQRMIILEEHNKQLEKQLRQSKQLLFKESPSHNLRRSVDRNLERQPNLLTIDNLFHMADDINRAVGDLVSVITEPQISTSPNYYQPLVT
ncbi:unnamed protein product, partial [Adineta ricciae]